MAKRVDFGRINRHAQSQLDRRPFHEDMMRLIEVGYMKSEFGQETWLATDLKATPDGLFATGVLAYELTQQRRHIGEFDESVEVPSWMKTDPTPETGATRGTTVPFAINLTSDRRWIAYAPSQWLNAKRFREYFAKMLDEAAARAGLLPVDWEVVPIQNPQRIYDWLDEHPDVALFVRVVKLPNPGLGKLPEDIRRMKEMAVREMEEKYKPAYGGSIRLRNTDALTELLDGFEDGDVEIRIVPRDGGPVFSSADDAEHVTVQDWGEDLELATTRVLKALVEFSQRRTQETDRGDSF